MKTYQLTDELQVIGRAGEYRNIAVSVNVAAWIAEYSDGAGGIMCERPDGKQIPLTVTISDGMMTAELPDECVSRPGQYAYTANWAQAGTVVKSQTYRALLMSAETQHHTCCGPSTPYWAQDIFSQAEQITSSLDAALQMAERADEAEAAQEAAEAAQEAAEAAQEAAETAQGKAEDAQAAAEAVLESIPEDYSELSADVVDLETAVSLLESGSLSALGASIGDVPVAKGNGSWDWVTLGYITPETFGAYGDGEHDDSDAINTALQNANGKAVRLIPGKTYLVSNKIVVPSNSTIVGYGAKIIKNHYYTFSLGDTSADTSNNFKNISFYGITGEANSGIRGLWMWLLGVDNLIIKDCSFKNNTPIDANNTSCWCITVSGSNILIDNCKIDQSGAGLYSDGVHVMAAENLTISNCTITNEDDCIGIVPEFTTAQAEYTKFNKPTKSVHIYGNTLHSTNNCIRLEARSNAPSNYYFSDVFITDNICTGNLRTIMILNDYRLDVSDGIDNNIVVDGIISTGNGSTNNDIPLFCIYGTLATSTTSTDKNIGNLVLKNIQCQMTADKREIFRIHNVQNVTIDGCAIDSASDYTNGITTEFTKCTNVSISNSYFSVTKCSAIINVSTCENFDVRNNVIEKTNTNTESGIGILFYGSSGDAYIIGNRFVNLTRCLWVAEGYTVDKVYYVDTIKDNCAGDIVGSARITSLVRPVTDVQVNGTSVLSNGVANVPTALQEGNYGVVKLGYESNGLRVDSNGCIQVAAATEALIKSGNAYSRSAPTVYQHNSVFYGLAKAAGDTSQSSSSNAVGTYTDNAKDKILTMLGIDALIAKHEGATASEAKTAGDAFIYNGKLYKATDSIASGAAIVPGTNCTQTTIIDLIGGN